MVTTIEGRDETGQTVVLSGEGPIWDRLVDRATGEVVGRARRLVTGGDPDARGRVPGAEEFRMAGEEFLPAPELESIAEALQVRHPGLFPWAADVEISYFWKDKGGVSEGKGVLGRCVKLSGLARKGIGGDFAIWLAADTAREIKLTAWQLEAAVFHELLHVGWDGDKGRPALAFHEFEGFRAELRQYGAWQPDLSQMVAAARQLPLFDEGEG